MHGPKTKRLTINISEELKAKIKAYSAFTNTPLGVFVNRVLIEKVQKIEKGEDAHIKIERKK
jgi:hypothetical protein